MKKRSVLVVGAASGLGRATSRRLAEDGWRVIAADRDTDGLATTAEEIGDGDVGARGRLSTHQVDVTDPAAVSRLMDAAARATWPLKGVVNCAGVAAVVPFEETSADLLRSMFEINVIGAHVLAQAATPVLRLNGGGAMVHVASVSGIRGNSGRAAYGASKGALIALTKVMAVELAADAIRVNVLAPGPVDTPLTIHAHGDATRTAWEAAVPVGRYGRPEEVASAAAFLVDDEASSFMTGEVMVVDGGFTSAGVRA